MADTTITTNTFSFKTNHGQTAGDKSIELQEPGASGWD
jgi:hypothetical protein